MCQYNSTSTVTPYVSVYQYKYSDTICVNLPVQVLWHHMCQSASTSTLTPYMSICSTSTLTPYVSICQYKYSDTIYVNLPVQVLSHHNYVAINDRIIQSRSDWPLAILWLTEEISARVLIQTRPLRQTCEPSKYLCNAKQLKPVPVLLSKTKIRDLVGNCELEHTLCCSPRLSVREEPIQWLPLLPSKFIPVCSLDWPNLLIFFNMKKMPAYKRLKRQSRACQINYAVESEW